VIPGTDSLRRARYWSNLAREEKFDAEISAFGGVQGRGAGHVPSGGRNTQGVARVSCMLAIRDAREEVQGRILGFRVRRGGGSVSAPCGDGGLLQQQLLLLLLL
jgi:hypothetical protein